MAKKSKTVETAPVGRQELVLHLKSMARLPDGTEVVPGANQVAPEVIAMVRTDTLMKKWLAKGLISIRENVPEPGSVQYDLAMGLPMSLLGLDLETIRGAVKLCRDRDRIALWLNDAGRQEVRTMLVDRSYEIAQEQSSNTAQPGATN